MPLDEHNPTPFAYTSGLMGRTLALLVSEVITCQLGGASIKYWYFKTGQYSQLEVCIRQPPGNKDLNTMRCYDGVSSTFARQWIFRAVELPPIAQPFEIVFKTFFSPPQDVIAIDDIVFEATLCGYSRDRREIRRIGYHDWQSYRQSKLYNGELMLIVAQDVADNLKSTTTTTTTTTEPETSSTMSTTITTTTTTTEATVLEAKISVVSTTETTPPDQGGQKTTTTTVFPSSTTTSPVDTEKQFANFVQFIKQAAPVIPYIPTLVRSLSGLDQRPELVPIDAPEFRRAPPVTSSHFYNTNQPLLTTSPPESQETLIQLAKKFGIIDDEVEKTTMVIPTTQNQNQFGLKSKLTAESIYPQNLIQKKIPLRRSSVPPTPVEELHRKLFTSTPPSPQTSTSLIVFKQPTSGEEDVAEKLADIAKLLPSGAVQDLTALRNIPDIEGLTKGMDLSEIRRPGESSNSGASEGAGGAFDSVISNPQLLDFEGNDVSIDTSQFEITGPPLTSPNRPVHLAAPTKSIGTTDLGGPRTGATFRSLCPQIDCNFDDNTFCNYVTSSSNSTADDGSTLNKWMLSARSVLNSLTGIPLDLSKSGSFIYAGGLKVSPDEIFVLSSNKPAKFPENSRLDFFAYQAGIRGQLRVCIDDDTNCPILLEGRHIDVDAQRWKNYYFNVPLGEHVIHFIVDGLFDNYVIGLDNIQLLNRFGTGALAC
ncbi:unnamed protein product [Caenorhabditis bovis]|uniref:MAM domain-containing protein n=1 Tax=Caenorhabditis bovis TaxID=2654633 RepID=A0A8S1EAC0_9PELO|nr:unnamed protein product [Caenorhabditis bovis]